MHATPASSALVFHQPSHATTLQQSLPWLATQAGLEASHGSGHTISSTAQVTVPGGVGMRVGTVVGSNEGFKDGLCVGGFDGEPDGVNVGKKDG